MPDRELASHAQVIVTAPTSSYLAVTLPNGLPLNGLTLPSEVRVSVMNPEPGTNVGGGFNT